MTIFKLKRTIKMGVKSLWLHKLRSGLTALGIVFGVASVVAMLAIGEGASQEAQDQIKQLGSHNIIITSKKPPSETAASSQGNTMLEYGLTYRDVEYIETTIPGVEVAVPVREIPREIYNLRRKTDGMIIGTVPWLPQIRTMTMAAGRFLHSIDMHQQRAVCVINKLVAERLFPYDNPLGETVRFSGNYYRVVGIIDDSGLNAQGEAAIKRVFVPITTVRSRFGETTMSRTGGTMQSERIELNQITVKVDEIERVVETAAAIRALLERRHGKPDFEMTVPLELLRQAEQTKRIFNIVLGSIAAISLLVGGIGIMNIMLASVTERTREIGIRRALGAKKKDIIAQFLTETVLLSGSGGLLGVILGVTLPLAVSHFAKMRTIVTPWSLFLSFGISAAVGIVFGIYPARRAANLDPIEALRHE